MTTIGNIILNETAGSAAHKPGHDCPPGQPCPTCESTNFRGGLRNNPAVSQQNTPGIAPTNTAINGSTKCWIA